MKKATKAALLSGLVFPGVGHLYLSQRLRGWVLLLGAVAAVAVLVNVAVERAQSIVDRIVSGEIPLDEGRIAQAVTDSSQGPDSLLGQAALIAFLACWVVGIVDSYRVGRRLEMPDAQHGKANDR